MCEGHLGQLGFFVFEKGRNAPQNGFILPLDEGDQLLRLTASKTACFSKTKFWVSRQREARSLLRQEMHELPNMSYGAEVIL